VTVAIDGSPVLESELVASVVSVVLEAEEGSVVVPASVVSAVGRVVEPEAKVVSAACVLEEPSEPVASGGSAGTQASEAVIPSARGRSERAIGALDPAPGRDSSPGRRRDATGHELFGSGTVLPSGKRAKHGFLALSELDSNADGRITKADERFDQLVLWADHDRNKRSTHAEHEPLSARGIVGIELGWRDEAICDALGNCGVERAAFTFIGAGGRVSTGEVIDVHLPCR
jgi:hypothetical protein